MSEILGFIIITLGICYLLFLIKAARDLDLIGRFINLKKERNSSVFDLFISIIGCDFIYWDFIY